MLLQVLQKDGLHVYRQPDVICFGTGRLGSGLLLTGLFYSSFISQYLQSHSLGLVHRTMETTFKAAYKYHRKNQEHFIKGAESLIKNMAANTEQPMNATNTPRPVIVIEDSADSAKTVITPVSSGVVTQSNPTIAEGELDSKVLVPCTPSKPTPITARSITPLAVRDLRLRLQMAEAHTKRIESHPSDYLLSPPSESFLRNVFVNWFVKDGATQCKHQLEGTRFCRRFCGFRVTLSYDGFRFV